MVFLPTRIGDVVRILFHRDKIGFWCLAFGLVANHGLPSLRF